MQIQKLRPEELTKLVGKPGTLYYTDIDGVVTHYLWTAGAFQPAAGFTAPQVTALQAVVSKYGKAASFGLLRIVTLGASITNGTGSSNAGVTAYSPLIGTSGNAAKWLRPVTYFGYPGQKASYIQTQIANALAKNPDVLILGPDFGTNGAADSDADLATSFITPFLAVYEACRLANVRLIACLTLPQGSATAAETMRGIAKQNLWLSTIAPKLGVDVIDTYSPLLDDSTGYMGSSYHSDGVHPNDTGHALIAAAVVAWLDSDITAPPWLVCGGLPGLSSNTLMTGAGTTPDGWSATVSPSTFAGTRTNALETASDAPYGRWYKVICDASVSGAGLLRTGSNTFAVTPGEQLLFAGWAKCAGTGSVVVQAWNVSATSAAATIFSPTNGGDSKPFAAIVTVPAGCTSMRLIMQINTSTGQTETGYLAACDVYRPSDLGLPAFP